MKLDHRIKLLFGRPGTDGETTQGVTSRESWKEGTVLDPAKDLVGAMGKPS